MPKNEKPETDVNWELATWEGARRECLRRWAQLPLERVIAALEEMQELSDSLSHTSATIKTAAGIQEQHGDYRHGVTRPATKTEE